MVALLNYVGKKALHHCGNYCTCLKLCALSMLTSVYTYIYLYVMHHHVKVQTSQVPRAVARRMIIFGNGWVPLGHLTMYRQECHNAQHTRGYIESTKSNFSGQDKSGIFWDKNILLYEKYFMCKIFDNLWFGNWYQLILINSDICCQIIWKGLQMKQDQMSWRSDQCVIN